MPQMAPMNWLLLFITFTITFLMFNTMNYFLYSPTMPKSIMLHNKSKSLLTWKW